MSDKIRKDDIGAVLAVGDFVYIGKGSWADAHFAVIRGLEKSMHTVKITKHGRWERGADGTRSWVVNGYGGSEDHIQYGARSVLRMKPEWIATLEDQEIANALMNERAKVLGGEYDKKKTKK